MQPGVRLLIVLFLTTISENSANRQLVDELAAELAGILNWAVQGLRELIQLNGFPNCSQCDLALAQHRTESDTVREFLDQCCAQAVGYEPMSRTVYDVYRFWCGRRQRKPVAENEFGRRMKRLGYQKARGSPQPDGRRPYVYLDLRLRADADWVVQAYIHAERPGWQQFPYAATPTCPGPSG